MMIFLPIEKVGRKITSVTLPSEIISNILSVKIYVYHRVYHLTDYQTALAVNFRQASENDGFDFIIIVINIYVGLL